MKGGWIDGLMNNGKDEWMDRWKVDRWMKGG